MDKKPRVELVVFSSKGQVVIPRSLRRLLEIEEGTRAVVHVQGDTIVLKPLTTKHLKSLRGLLV